VTESELAAIRERLERATPGPARQFHVARSLGLGGLAEKLKGGTP
jgi:hypothetical protein